MTTLSRSMTFSVGEWDTSLSCYYCGRELLPPYDYSCFDCGRLTCDNHQEICQQPECDYPITCYRCMEAHSLTCTTEPN